MLKWSKIKTVYHCSHEVPKRSIFISLRLETMHAQKRRFCRNNLSTVSTRSETKTERSAVLCEHEHRFCTAWKPKHLRSPKTVNSNAF
jgi:hypothetical protein